jgi:hypothetical protein
VGGRGSVLFGHASSWSKSPDCRRAFVSGETRRSGAAVLPSPGFVYDRASRMCMHNELPGRIPWNKASGTGFW